MLLAVRSALTLPTVANTSGMVSTASNKASGSSGRPNAEATGMLVAMKLTWPGKPTEPRLMTTASTTAIPICITPTSTPYNQAMNAETTMYWMGLVMRNRETAMGSTNADAARG